MAQLPGAYPASVYMQAPPPYISDPPIRNGKFPDLAQFMVMPDDTPPPPLRFRLASVVDLRPGWIIYIRDQQTRLDQRVMLVLRESTAGFTCVTFCLHWPPASPNDHWKVCSSTAPENRGESRRWNWLRVVLRPYGREPRLAPRDDITVNISDLWNVENEVNVAVLGYVRERSMLKVVEAVKHHFRESLNQAMRDMELDNSSGRRRRS